MNYHIECGRHSGIPECCINWFIGPWSSVRIFGWVWTLYWRENNKGGDVEYIRCLECIKNLTVVDIKECDCEGR